jgi:uncharacterized damage-inducible protein DinB
MQTLKDQYGLIKDSREVVLEYCQSIKSEDLSKEIESFNKNSIMYMLLHIANTYLFWLKRFAGGEEFGYFKEENVKDIAGMRIAFEKVNKTVDAFLNKHTDYNSPIEGEIFWLKKNMTFTVLQLVTHIFTHEFHHKGQLMTMTRILGYTPPDADIIRF